jgi:hypothetical protein
VANRYNPTTARPKPIAVRANPKAATALSEGCFNQLGLDSPCSVPPAHWIFRISITYCWLVSRRRGERRNARCESQGFTSGGIAVFGGTQNSIHQKNGGCQESTNLIRIVGEVVNNSSLLELCRCIPGKSPMRDDSTGSERHDRQRCFWPRNEMLKCN